MTGAVIFTAALGCFLGGCLIAAIATDTSDDETQRSLGLGGGSLADELRRHASGPNPDWVEHNFHEEGNK